jgi:hypothetical protein
VLSVESAGHTFGALFGTQDRGKSVELTQTFAVDRQRSFENESLSAVNCLEEVRECIGDNAPTEPD